MPFLVSILAHNLTFVSYCVDQPKQATPKKKSSKATASTIVLAVGTRVDGLFEGHLGGELWYPGQITKVHANGTYDISYDDGDAETEVPGKYIHYVPDSDDASTHKNNESTPGAADAPEETDTPGAANAPGETDTPGAADAPGETDTPGAADAPGETDTPGAADALEEMKDANGSDE